MQKFILMSNFLNLEKPVAWGDHPLVWKFSMGETPGMV